MIRERQLTFAAHNHILTNTGVWSPDGEWIVYDIRSDPAGANFDGTRIEKVNVHTGEVKVLYESRNGAHCGVATYHPREDKVVFILGPKHPTPDWQYAANRRQGVIVDGSNPGVAINLDARDIVPPFTPGALRGGSHVHVFSPDGQWVSFTYQDQVLESFARQTAANDVDLRNVGVGFPKPVIVPKSHPRNHDGNYFSVLVTRTTAEPAPGSDEIRRAFDDAWVGRNGYTRADGWHQRRAIAFQGEVVIPGGQSIVELFIVDLPDDLTVPGDGPLEGTETRRPFPPAGATQRRLTYTADREFPGLQGPRHWPRSSPDGSRIAFLMKDDNGIAQLWTISSAFTWNAEGTMIAHAMDNSVFVTDMSTGGSRRVSAGSDDLSAPRPEACVFSPDGHGVAFIRQRVHQRRLLNQVFAILD